MRTLETDRLIIRAFTLEDGDAYSRLLDAAFGADLYGSPDAKRVMFEYQVAADAGHALLHQPPSTARSCCEAAVRSSALSVSRRASCPSGSCRRSSPPPASHQRWDSSGRSFPTSRTTATRRRLRRR